jgi:predicted RNase H-like HicB family nuclease
MDTTLHAVVYKAAKGECWVATCVEFDITSEGDSEQDALMMLQQAVELHLEDITPEELDQIDNAVGSKPLLKSFSIHAPAILQR